VPLSQAECRIIDCPALRGMLMSLDLLSCPLGTATYHNPQRSRPGTTSINRTLPHMLILKIKTSTLQPHHRECSKNQ
jgi:hypothetical protein